MAEYSKKESLIQAITAKVPHVRDPNGVIQTVPFLDTCRMVLPVVGAWWAGVTFIA